MRNCTYKGEPFCKRHTPKETSQTDETCLVCFEGSVFPTKCCEFKICRDCLIKTGKDKCCHCGMKLKLDENTKGMIEFIQHKETQINELNGMIHALRAQLVENQLARAQYEIHTIQNNPNNFMIAQRVPGGIPPNIADALTNIVRVLRRMQLNRQQQE